MAGRSSLLGSFRTGLWVRSHAVTNAAGEASWSFVAERDPGADPGALLNADLAVEITVHRAALEKARRALSDALFGGIPEILRGFVDTLFSAFIGPLQQSIAALIDTHALGSATIEYHGKPPASPVPTLPSPSPLSVGDPCALITQEEAAREAGKEVLPGFQVPTVIDGLGSGAACIFRDADFPSGQFGVAHIRIDVVDLGTGGGQRFAAAGLGISDGHVPNLGDDNFYFCADPCGPASLFVRRANLAFLVHDVTPDGLAGATRLARLALQRLDSR